jgi:hypothetical protein
MQSATDSDTVVPPGETAPDKAIRRALCEVLERLGSDAVSSFMNGDSPDELTESISLHVKWLEERAREHERGKFLPALKRALDEAEDLATMYDHYADVSNAPASFAEQRALHPSLARTEPLPPLSPVAATFFQMRRENEALHKEVARLTASEKRLQEQVANWHKWNDEQP